MAVTSDLPYLINDADNHFNEPPDCFERYIDPQQQDLAIRFVTGPDGRQHAALRRQALEVQLESDHLLDRRARKDARRHLEHRDREWSCHMQEGEPELIGHPRNVAEPAQPPQGPDRTRSARRSSPSSATSPRPSAIGTCDWR